MIISVKSHYVSMRANMLPMTLVNPLFWMSKNAMCSMSSTRKPKQLYVYGNPIDKHTEEAFGEHLLGAFWGHVGCPVSSSLSSLPSPPLFFPSPLLASPLHLSSLHPVELLSDEGISLSPWSVFLSSSLPSGWLRAWDWPELAQPDSGGVRVALSACRYYQHVLPFLWYFSYFFQVRKLSQWDYA